MKQPLVILSGPTAAGKTKLSIALAHAIGGEIISADSMQVYRHMDIGTAKIKPSETEGVPHYLIDCLNPDEEFNVAVFCEMADEAAKQILGRCHIPILVGGTGFYIQAFLRGVTFEKEDHSDGYREELERTALMPDGPARLHKKLSETDPASALAIPVGNVKRVIRALTFEHYHGFPISEHNLSEMQKEPRFRFAYFVLEKDRAELYRGIEERVDGMMREGLLEEVKKLCSMGYANAAVAMQGLGYKEVIDYLNGDCTYDEMVYTLKQRTRHFAKRQMTWFRREKDVIFLDKNEHDEDELLKVISDVLSDKGIIQ